MSENLKINFMLALPLSLKRDSNVEVRGFVEESRNFIRAFSIAAFTYALHSREHND